MFTPASRSILKNLATAGLIAASTAGLAHAQSAPSVSAYAGKYPYEAVRGVKFFDNPRIASLIDQAVRDPEIRTFIRDTDNVVTPLRETRGRYLTAGWSAATGGDVNWAVLLVADGSKAAVCYSTGVEQDVRGSDWYLDGELAFTLYMSCPTRPEDIEEALGDWPIGGVPG